MRSVFSPAVILVLSLASAACSFTGASPEGLGPASARASLDTCLASVAGKKLNVGQTNLAVPVLERPLKGLAFHEPSYNTCLVRATDYISERPNGFARNDYSRRQAFNADNTRLIVYSLDGRWHLYSAEDFSYLQALPGPLADAEPQWHPTDPNRLYYLPNIGAGMMVYELNINTGATREVGSLEDRLQARWPNANAAWTRSEGSPSRDARYWAFIVDDTEFNALGLVVWDLTEDKIVGYYDTTDRPDHLSMSPSGKYVVVSWDDRIVAFDRNLTNPRQLHNRTEHSDLAIGANGHDMLVSIDYGANDGDIFMVDLETGERTDLLPTYINGTATAMHFSGKGYGRPGWVLVSTYAGTPDRREWLHDKVFALELKAKPRVVELAHHHGIDKGYWSEPQATVSRDFSRVLFNSNWDNPVERDIDAYFLQIPPGALPD